MRAFSIGLILAVLGGIGFIALEGIRFASSPLAPEVSNLLFEVRPGEGLSSATSRLQKTGLIKQPLYFKIFARFSGHADGVRLGEYELKGSMKPGELLDVLASGKSVQRQFTVPEGWNVFEIARLLKEKGIVQDEPEVLTAARDPALVRELLGEDLPSLEGYLFPETYSYTKYTKLNEVLRMMVDHFKAAYKGLENGAAILNLSRHQVVTLASVIEKETGAPEERPMISSVFHNRLHKGMPLQSDPTIIYGMWVESGIMPTNIRKEDILRKTPYNTYTIPALPVGPIANPGKLALTAAVTPAKSDYFFFVSRNDGTHVFNADLKSHTRAVGTFQVNPKARQGKSWRDLEKKDKAPATSSNSN